LSVFETKKGRHLWHEQTICELHRQIYDHLVANGDIELLCAVVPLLEKAYICGIKMTKKLVEYKLSLPEWDKHENIEEVRKLRQLRTELQDAISTHIQS
jgi:hypothetical protein